LSACGAGSSWWRFTRSRSRVNNAGAILRRPAAEHPDEHWDRILEINLNSQFVLAREFGKDMVARGHGRIIFTASLLTFQGGVTVPGYAASKGGIGQLTMALANEWAQHGVNVNAIAPGYVATDNTAALRADPQRGPAILSRIPARRWGQPDDFQGAVVFLASQADADRDWNYVDEQVATYPSPEKFGYNMPAYGMFFWHVDGLTMDNVNVGLMTGTSDARPQFAYLDVVQAPEPGVLASLSTELLTILAAARIRKIRLRQGSVL
jgi:hypothetical protein